MERMYRVRASDWTPWGRNDESKLTDSVWLSVAHFGSLGVHVSELVWLCMLGDGGRILCVSLKHREENLGSFKVAPLSFLGASKTALFYFVCKETESPRGSLLKVTHSDMADPEVEYPVLRQPPPSFNCFRSTKQKCFSVGKRKLQRNRSPH